MINKALAENVRVRETSDIKKGMYVQECFEKRQRTIYHGFIIV